MGVVGTKCYAHGRVRASVTHGIEHCSTHLELICRNINQMSPYSLAYIFMYLTYKYIVIQMLHLFFILQKDSLIGKPCAVHSFLLKNCIEMVKNQNKTPHKCILPSNAGVWRMLYRWRHWRNEGDFFCLLSGINKGVSHQIHCMTSGGESSDLVWRVDASIWFPRCLILF